MGLGRPDALARCACRLAKYMRFMGWPRNPEQRSGIAAMEMAVCLPAIVVLVFAAIESCTAIFLTQALQSAGYEAVRVAINANGTTSQAQQRAQQILDAHSIVGSSVRCEPPDVSGAKAGDQVTVVVTAGYDGNRISPSFFFGGRTVEVRTTMAKE
jgi:Flp pilus assembly protein TadG